MGRGPYRRTPALPSARPVLLSNAMRHPWTDPLALSAGAGARLALAAAVAAALWLGVLWAMAA